MKATTKLKQLITSGPIVVAPGAYDGLTARLIEQAGFPAVYASGGAISRSTGIPDLGLMSMSEIVHRLETMVDAIDIPLIGDADTGYGNALNAQHAARAFQRAGVAGFHIEDQAFPKKCGHYEDKSIIPSVEMQQKIRAVRDALTDDDFTIVARTDGLAVEGFEKTIERGHAYMEAGADVIFIEAPTSIEQIEKIAELLPYPKLINMFHSGKTPLVSSQRLAELGYRVVIIPSDLQRAAIGAMTRTLQVIGEDGHSAAMQEHMVSFKDREQIIGTDEYVERDRRYSA